MATQVDERGKIFTDVVRKKPVKVIVQTNKQLLMGTFHKGSEERLLDSMNNYERFVPLTDVHVLEARGTEPEFKSKFLIVNRNSINWMMPSE